MILQIEDWKFSVDIEKTAAHTAQNSQDHCMCAYCRNYYETVSASHPKLYAFLEKFGIRIEGPSELMPFEPTLLLACYRVNGEILQWGKTALYAGNVPILPESSEGNTFLLWVGEMQLPWIMEENMKDVVSPANLPEFMERMQEMWLLRHGNEFVFS